jgi:hypothetical protein
VKYNTEERQSTYDLATIMGTLNIRDNTDHAVRILNFALSNKLLTSEIANTVHSNICNTTASQVQIQQRSSLPSEERTLFVTFSNGYPFTKEELYEFFMRYDLFLPG